MVPYINLCYYRGQDDDAGLAEELGPHDAEQEVQQVEAGAVQEIPPLSGRQVLHREKARVY
jgi:hypothetical protein